jgi:hypothetical protein
MLHHTWIPAPSQPRQAYGFAGNLKTFATSNCASDGWVKRLSG